MLIGGEMVYPIWWQFWTQPAFFLSLLLLLLLLLPFAYRTAREQQK